MSDPKTLLANLLEEPPSVSRNKNFALFDTPELQQTLRTKRYLLSIERDLLDQTAQTKLEPVPQRNGFYIHINRPSLRSVRSCFVQKDELGLLLGRQGLQDKLQPLLDALQDTSTKP